MIRFAPSVATRRRVRTSRLAPTFVISLSSCIASFSCTLAPAPTSPAPIVVTQTESAEDTGRCEARTRAQALSDEADATLKVNVAGAIAAYEKALTLDPKAPGIYYKLALAHQKAKQWERMESALAHATALAPNIASYAYLRGYALVQLGLEGEPSAFHRAKPLLQHCIQLDPNLADCHTLLGVTAEATLDIHVALQSYTRAVQADPARAENYVALGTLYYELDRPSEATTVFQRASEELAPSEDNSVALSNLHVAWAKVAASRGDTALEIAQLQKAMAFAKDHPEIEFRLGRAYTITSRNAEAKAALTAFTKRVCRGAFANTYRSECGQAAVWLQRIESLHGLEPQ